MQPEQKPAAAMKEQQCRGGRARPAGGITSNWGVPGVRWLLALWLCPHAQSCGRAGCAREVFSCMGCSCLGSGQNGGTGFEKETCLLFFKQQKGKLKDWDLPSRFSLRH